YFVGAGIVGRATFNLGAGDTITFTGASSAGSAIISNAGIFSTLGFHDSSSAADASISVNNFTSTLSFDGNSAADISNLANTALFKTCGGEARGASTSITNNGEIHFGDNPTAGTANIFNDARIVFGGSASTAGGAAITNHGGGDVEFAENSSSGNA